MYRLGVDLGGTNIAVGLVDENMNLVAKKSTPTGADRPAEMIVDDIAMLCKGICADNGIALSDIACIGIATPGIANTATGVVEYANNLPFKKFPIADLLKARVSLCDELVRIHILISGVGELKHESTLIAILIKACYALCIVNVTLKGHKVEVAVTLGVLGTTVVIMNVSCKKSVLKDVHPSYSFGVAMLVTKVIAEANV
jgi:hypothetical protein